MDDGAHGRLAARAAVANSCGRGIADERRRARPLRHARRLHSLNAAYRRRRYRTPCRKRRSRLLLSPRYRCSSLRVGSLVLRASPLVWAPAAKSGEIFVPDWRKIWRREAHFPSRELRMDAT
ncbi:hypothetical protein QYE76_025820 [Lolium multiflorum]|uniref:Uncharacterized protein n=1 Tax=Lolium multiflorum TaxID=4521 RepID=A0AAD8RES4_LOLMU|nr:hypothetical protein QYE76_025820 [Lolium multiflorum]